MKWHNKGEKYGIKDALLNRRKIRISNKKGKDTTREKNMASKETKDII